MDKIKARDVTIFFHPDTIRIVISRGYMYAGLESLFSEKEHDYHRVGDCIQPVNEDINPETQSVLRLRHVLETYPSKIRFVGGNFGWISFLFVGQLKDEHSS